MSSKNSSALLGLMLALALMPPEQQKRTGGGIGGPGPKPIDRKPMSRKLVCPTCDAEAVLIRSTGPDGSPMNDLHFLQDDGNHLTAGLVYPDEATRDRDFDTMDFERVKALYAELMISSLGSSMGLAEMVLGQGRR